MTAFRYLVPFGALVSLLPVGEARGDDLSCLRSLRGHRVLWDADWQADRQDHGIAYRVESVADSLGAGGQPEVTVELSASGAAMRERRTAHIIREHVARMVCARAADSNQQIEIERARARAHRQDRFRRQHARAIDSLLNGPVDVRRVSLRSRYLDAFESEDFGEAERILHQFDPAAIRR